VALTKVTGFGIGTIVDDVVMTSDDPTITMTDSSGTNDIATIQATSGALIVTARDGSADGEIIFKKTDGSATDETMRITSTGNVGIGTSSPDSLVHLSGANPKLHIRNSSDSNRGGYLQDNGTTFVLGSNSGVRNLVFSPDNTERMRIDTSGKILCGISSSFGGGATGTIETYHSGTAALGVGRSDTDLGGCVRFFKVSSGGSGTQVGSIDIGSSSTSYVTSSDYRLKTNVLYDWDATSRLKQLKPARFDWISEGDDAVTVDGFLAHEAQAVVPEAVTGTHNEVDDDGNPVYQGIDQAKIVPLLVKTLQEAITKIETLEAKVQALEDA